MYEFILILMHTNILLIRFTSILVHIQTVKQIYYILQSTRKKVLYYKSGIKDVSQEPIFYMTNNSPKKTVKKG